MGSGVDRLFDVGISGASGDMIIGSFLEAGFDFPLPENEPAKLDLSGCSVSCEKCRKNGISAAKSDVTVSSAQPAKSKKKNNKPDSAGCS